MAGEAENAEASDSYDTGCEGKYCHHGGADNSVNSVEGIDVGSEGITVVKVDEKSREGKETVTHRERERGRTETIQHIDGGQVDFFPHWRWW